MSSLTTTLGRGAAAGLAAGVPQVILAQAEARVLDLPGDRADIGPRFVRRVAERFDAEVGPALRWVVAGGFHFGYAAWWGIRRCTRLPKAAASTSSRTAS